jgi:hypothetical protein
VERRDFLNSSSAAALAAAFTGMGGDFAELFAGTTQTPHEDAANARGLSLTQKIDPELARAAYESGNKGVSSIPYVYAFYDEAAKGFITPLKVVPTLKKKAYTMEAALHSFNIRSTNQSMFKNLNNQVQLGFNITTPVSESEQLTWVFMNAVDVFLAKDKNRPDQLTKFAKDGSGTPLQSSPKVKVVDGKISLQITARGQKQVGLWNKIFDSVTKAVRSPIASTALKGFGIPGLALDALVFVDQVVNVIARQEQLEDLWSTGALEFAVTEDTPARFKMKPGLWAIVDSDYAQGSEFLSGHTVDLDFQSFRILNKDKKPIDANYLVTDINFSTAL